MILPGLVYKMLNSMPFMRQNALLRIDLLIFNHSMLRGLFTCWVCVSVMEKA
jgi:hypothetical protein